MKMPEFREYLHTLNPNVVLNSRMQGYGDYETPEQGIPLYGPKGEWEFCTTINDSWGYRPSDNDYKSSGQIVRMFCDCITLGGRMLLDIGPKEDGTLDERQEKFFWIWADGFMTIRKRYLEQKKDWITIISSAEARFRRIRRRCIFSSMISRRRHCV